MLYVATTNMLNICRLCLGISCVEKSLKDDEGDLLSKVLLCSPVKPSLTDELPYGICNDCVQNIRNINEYFNIIISADNKLQSALASGIDALTSFYEDILQFGNIKKEPVTEKTHIELVSIEKQTCISKSSKTTCDIEIKSEDEECEKKENTNNNNCNSNNSDYLDFVHKTEVTDEEYDSDDNISLINFASNPDVGKKPKLSKKTPVESNNSDRTVTKNCKKTKSEVITNVNIGRQCGKLRMKSVVQTKDVQKSMENPRGQVCEYKCKICYKFFESLSLLTEHGNTHTGAKPFGCDWCGNAYMYPQYLRSHIKAVHPKVPLFQCGTCGKKFKEFKTLFKHRRLHSKELKHLCNICGKTLSSQDHLKRHIRIHGGIKPHKCETCGKAFVRKSTLTEHKRVHSGERPYDCSYCNKSFSQRSSLVIHERYHSGEGPYVCHLCNKGFTAKGMLNVHMKRTCI